MAHTSGHVEGTIRKFLRRAKKSEDGVSAQTRLYAGGIGLTSLDTAELAAVLEDELGTDPFSHGFMPETIGEIVDFYDKLGPEAEPASP
jgi:acyl carrier protein